MSELMKHRGYVIIRNKRRLTRCRFLVIEDVGYNRLLVQRMRLIYKVTHPGTTAFIATGVEIQIINSQGLTVTVENFISNHIRMIYLQICSFLKSNTVKLLRSIENTFLQIGIHLIIRFNFIFVQVIFGLPYLL